jgi:hypothetical protein
MTGSAIQRLKKIWIASSLPLLAVTAVALRLRGLRRAGAGGAFRRRRCGDDHAALAWRGGRRAQSWIACGLAGRRGCAGRARRRRRGFGHADHRTRLRRRRRLIRMTCRAADDCRRFCNAADLVLLRMCAAERALRIGRRDAGNRDPKRTGQQPSWCRLVHVEASHVRAANRVSRNVVFSRRFAKGRQGSSGLARAQMFRTRTTCGVFPIARLT